MSILHKIKKPKADVVAKSVRRDLSFKALSPREALPDLAADEDKRSAIVNERANCVAERRALQAEIDADKTIDIDPAVAELIGEPPSTKAQKRERVAELRRREIIAEQAIELIEKRIMATRSTADRAVCAAARPEAERRVATLCEALQAVDAAHVELNDLILAIEEQGVSAGGLGQIKPFFLGDAQDRQRKIQEYLREVREAGYYAN